MPALTTIAIVTALSLGSPSVSFVGVKSAKKDYYTTSLRLPVFAGTTWAERVNKDVAAKAKASLAAWLKDSFPNGAGKPRLTYYFESSTTISLLTPKAVSFFFTISTFTAGAHPMTVSDPHTYLGGKEVHSADIFARGSSYPTVVSNLVIGKLMNNLRAAWVQDGTVKEMTKAQQESFVVTPTALCYLFNPYDLGPYAVGAFQVKIPFSELRAVLKPGLNL